MLVSYTANLLEEGVEVSCAFRATRPELESFVEHWVARVVNTGGLQTLRPFVHLNTAPVSDE